MKNPILSDAGFRIYALIWFIIILIHSSILGFFYDYGVTVAIVDSLVFNLSFAALVPGFWYIVLYAGLNKDELSLIVTHLGAAALMISIWLFVSDFVLQLFFYDRIEYLAFSDEAFVWRFIVGILFYSITVLIFYLVKYYQDMQERQNRELELQHLLKDSELRMLKSQINPHFIFNSLNSISALTISRAEQAQEMVIKLSNFLRYSLGKDSVEMNTLEEEINNVSLYLEIEKVRFGSKLSFEKHISDACLKVEVPNLILQPLFENAIKYGVYESTDSAYVRLSCESNKDFLHVSVRNNFDPEATPPKGEGIGLENVKKRLSLVFNRNDLLEVTKTEQEFEVILKIPLTQPDHE